MENENAAAPGRSREEFHPKTRGPTLKLFLLCLLASGLCTLLGLLGAAAILPERSAKVPETSAEVPETSAKVPETSAEVPEGTEPRVDGKFRFLRRLGRAKPHTYPGGEIRWARSSLDYENAEEAEFGRSLGERGAGISAALLRLRGRAMRIPHWDVEVNEHVYIIEGHAWAGVVLPGRPEAAVFPLSPGQVAFFPRRSLRWLRNAGARQLRALLFFSAAAPGLGLGVDGAFFGTPEDVLARDLKPLGGADFIRTFRKPALDQALNLPEDLELLVTNSSETPAPPEVVSKFFYDLPASREFPFPGGIFRWARFRNNGTGLSEAERSYSESLGQHEGALTLATLRIFSGSLGAPHFHSNADEMAAVLRGCGLAGVVTPDGASSRFLVNVGDVVFFPAGSQHFLQSFCQDELELVLAYSTNKELETLRMKEYFQAIPQHVLAQLFHKEQGEFHKLPKIP